MRIKNPKCFINISMAYWQRCYTKCTILDASLSIMQRKFQNQYGCIHTYIYTQAKKRKVTKSQRDRKRRENVTFGCLFVCRRYLRLFNNFSIGTYTHIHIYKQLCLFVCAYMRSDPTRSQTITGIFWVFSTDSFNTRSNIANSKLLPAQENNNGSVLPYPNNETTKVRVRVEVEMEVWSCAEMMRRHQQRRWGVFSESRLVSQRISKHKTKIIKYPQTLKLGQYCKNQKRYTIHKAKTKNTKLKKQRVTKNNLAT